MTLFRVEHAVVMDTDDIPGRGGYALVGVSPGASQAERAFVAQNFGISDYLHNPQLDKPGDTRIFYSFFRVPGSDRRALVRRFGHGLRRNHTQNRLFVHTLFLDAALFEHLGGLPWLLLNGKFRAAGATAFESLTKDMPWLTEGGEMPALEWQAPDNARPVAEQLGHRVAATEGKHAVASVIAALSTQKRVVLPQGSELEMLTLVAWSMLPWPDREELAWTQHDTANIAGVTFPLANAPAASFEISASAPPDWALDIVNRSLDEKSRRDFQEGSRNARHPLTVRDSVAITKWLQWRSGVEQLKRSLGGSDADVVLSMQRLVKIAVGHEDAPWIDRDEILRLVWEKVSSSTAGEWANRFSRSNLGRVIFRVAPDPRWLDDAAKAGADALVAFVLEAAGKHAETAPARDAVAAWLVANSTRGVSFDHLAELAVRVAADGSPSAQPLLEALLASDEGLSALIKRGVTEAPALVFAATPIVLKHRHPHTPEFLRDVLIEHLKSVPASRDRVTATLARAVAEQLRRAPDDLVDFASRLSLDVRRDLTELATSWLFAEQSAATVKLGCEVMKRVATGGPETLPLAIALAGAGVPASAWFAVLVDAARSIDATNDATAIDFHRAIEVLRKTKLKLQGAGEPLLNGLRQATTFGPSLRTLTLLALPAWGNQAGEVIAQLVAIAKKTSSLRGWESLIAATAETYGAKGSEMVMQYWISMTDPRSVPSLDRSVIEAIASLTERDREWVQREWQSRIRQVPEGPASELLLDRLYGDLMSPDVRIQRGLRDIEQDRATHETLNDLDAALDEKYGESYGPHMAEAVAHFVADAEEAVRIRKICALLAAGDVDQTVKRVIEAHVLPKAVRRLRSTEWRDVIATLSDDELFRRGVPRLTIARAIGNGANDETLAAYESVCRDAGYGDALLFATAGRRERSMVRRLGQRMGLA